MTFPEIPDEAYSAACVEMDGEIGRALHRAWPFLYAAALRHAADEIEDWESGEPLHDSPAVRYIRRMADEATP